MARPRVRQRLLEAAAALLAEQGVGVLTTRAVARRAAVTEASLFNNFGDKAGLLRALLLETGDEHPALLTALAAPAEPFEAWLARLFVHARAWFRRVLPLAGASLASAPPRHADPQGQASYAAHRALSQRLAELQQPDPETLALLLLGAAMHTTLSELTQGDRALAVDEQALARRVARSLARR
ncbi:TetR family transcriptional regulator [Pseudomonas sp. UL073]|uniref:TetR family transcriptional regulator n=1 Tax=Zestomonas insulae TaxID=2809017 RepID=A0ABS2IB18_9GAMM|nr:TetR family transcriptional regulator [Pseudomonas insulae]MBM7060321.1 TetR family transcriptional regulator [Pseudomonas insulae]